MAKLLLKPQFVDARISATLAMGELVRKCQPVHNLGLGASPFPIPAVLVNAMIEHAQEKEYLPVGGLPLLRKSIASYYSSRLSPKSKFSEDDVVIVPGSKQLLFGLSFVLNIPYVGASPAWVSYSNQCYHLQGTRPVIQHATFESEWKLTAETLRELCRKVPGPKYTILNSPCNPTGLAYTSEELQALAAVAREEQLYIVSDEIYSDLLFEDDCPSIAKFLPEQTIISSGLSKNMGAGGWRLGYGVFPSELQCVVKALLAAHSEIFSCVTAPIQHAACLAFDPLTRPEIDVILLHQRRILQRVGLYCYHRLNAAGVRTHPPTGAWYIMGDFEPFRQALSKTSIESSADSSTTATVEMICTSNALQRALLLRHKVVCVAGCEFDRPAEELTLRFSLVDFDGKALLQDPDMTAPLQLNQQQLISERDCDLVEKQCPKLVAGINEICSFLDSIV